MKTLLIYCLLISFFPLPGQDYSVLKKVRISLEGLDNLDSVERKEDLDRLWNELKAKQHILWIIEDSVFFFYLGPARSVAWMGDFNGWGFIKDFKNQGQENSWYRSLCIEL